MTVNIHHLGLFVTENCNLACSYCFASNMEKRIIDEDLARRTIDLVLTAENEAQSIGITFWGGEPLLVFNLLQSLVRHAKARAHAVNKEVRFAIPTNVTLLTEEMIDFFQTHQVNISLSLDGGAAAQGLRRTVKGESSFPTIQKKLELILSKYPKHRPGVRMTVSPETVGGFYDNVRFFLDQGIWAVYYAPVLEAEWSDRHLAQFETGQTRLIDYWLKELKAGRPMVFASLDKAMAWRELLRRGLMQPNERQIPCGAGSHMIAVDIYGDIFPCHRFVFYDKSKRAQGLGNVGEGLPREELLQPYIELDQSRLGTKARSCSECPSAQACHSICPALNYTLSGDIHKVHERLCKIVEMEIRLVERIFQSAGDKAYFQDYLEKHVMKNYAKGALSASTMAFFSRLEQADTDTLADRAEKILGHLQQRRRF